MNLVRSCKFSSLLSILLALTSLHVSCQRAAINSSSAETPFDGSPSPREDIRKWIAPTHFGLTLGRSKEGDVKQIFGKPVWEGENNEKVFEGEEDELLLQYVKVGELKDNIDNIVGKTTRLVKAIAVYPLERGTKNEVIESLGPDFFEIESSDSMCITRDRAIGESKVKLHYPIALVYPNKGMYVQIREDGRVGHVGYGMKCFDK